MTVEALAVAEGAKGRSLLDVLRGERRRDDAGAAEGRSHLRELERRVAELNKRVEAGDRSAATSAALNEARNSRDESRESLETRQARHQPPAPVRALRPHELDALVADGRVFVEHLVTERRLHIIVVRRAGGHALVRVRTLPLGRDAVARVSATLLQAVATRNYRYRAAARAAYDAFIKPVAPWLAGARVICLVPDGQLWKLPFQALVGSDGRFLGEQFACFYSPSMVAESEMLARSAAPRTRRTLLAFANPSPPGALPDAEAEGKAIARMYGASGRLHTRAEALERLAKEESGGYAVLHFATHGVIDNRNPLYSYLVLTPSANEDGRLEAWEVMDLDLHADLAVLSACETARGRFNAGEGEIGMAWAFLMAGCPTTVVSQWRADSAATAALMVDFHRRLLGGASPAEALRAAQTSLRSDPALDHPFYWAAFVVLGDGAR